MSVVDPTARRSSDAVHTQPAAPGGALGATSWALARRNLVSIARVPSALMPSLVFPIFGGLYTTAGPILGTIVLRAFEEYLRVTPPWKEGYQVVYGAVIVIAVLFIPRGVLGLVQRYAPGALALVGGRRWRSSK